MGTVLERGTTRFGCLKPSKIEGLFFPNLLDEQNKKTNYKEDERKTQCF